MNKNILINGLTFAVGVAIGSVVTWKVVKTRYEKISEEEIESVREAYKKKYTSVEEPNTEEKETIHVAKDLAEGNESVKQALDICKKEGYVVDIKKEEDAAMKDEPYVISPEEFGENDYVINSLTYYSDGTVANEKNKIVSNTEELIGKDFAEHFGDYDYDPDAVYVRNDRIRVDYEILKDYRAYSETI